MASHAHASTQITRISVPTILVIPARLSDMPEIRFLVRTAVTPSTPELMACATSSMS